MVRGRTRHTHDGGLALTGIGTSHGCISVINGIVNGTGAVLGIALETVAEYTEGGDSQNVIIEGCQTDDSLARICVREAMLQMRLQPCGYTLRIRSEIPPSRGLKSSSSVCNAVIKAVFDEHKYNIPVLDTIRIGVRCAVEAGVTVTGSFDDACGCEMGGFIMTSNYENRILERKSVLPLPVILCIPDHIKRKVPRSAYEARADDIKVAIGLCKCNICAAMTMNGRIIAQVTGESGDLVELAMANGALGAGVSGTGPAVAIVCDEYNVERIAKLMPCETIITEVR